MTIGPLPTQHMERCRVTFHVCGGRPFPAHDKKVFGRRLRARPPLPAGSRTGGTPMVKTNGNRPYWIVDGIVFWSKAAMLEYRRNK